MLAWPPPDAPGPPDRGRRRSAASSAEETRPGRGRASVSPAEKLPASPGRRRDIRAIPSAQSSQNPKMVRTPSGRGPGSVSFGGLTRSEPEPTPTPPGPAPVAGGLRADAVYPRSRTRRVRRTGRDGTVRLSGPPCHSACNGRTTNARLAERLRFQGTQTVVGSCAGRGISGIIIVISPACRSATGRLSGWPTWWDGAPRPRSRRGPASQVRTPRCGVESSTTPRPQSHPGLRRSFPRSADRPARSNVHQPRETGSRRPGPVYD